MTSPTMLKLGKTRLLPLGAALSLALAIAACNGGGDDDPPLTGKVKVVADRTTTLANDLRGVVFSSSGKIYASGHSGPATSDRLTVVARFNADGSPDTTFGSGGVVTFNLVVKEPGNPTSTGDEQSSGIVELSNGDLIVAVNAADNNGGAPITGNGASIPRPEGLSVMLLRITSAGAPVPTFGTNGRVKVDFGWTEADNAAWPAPTVNAGGTALVGNGYPRDTMWNIALDPSVTGANERVVIFGFGPAARNSSGGTQRVDVDRYIARVLASTGAPDPNFNSGKAFTWNSPESAPDNGRHGIVEADGRILSAGYSVPSGVNRVTLLRLTASGQLDAAFTGFGLSPVQPGVAVFNAFAVNGGVSEAYGIGKQSDGKVVTTGYGNVTAVTVPPTPSTLGYASTLMVDMLSYRVANGAVDTTWGTNGVLVQQSEGKNRPTTEDRGRDLIVLKDDRVIEVGRYGGGSAIYVLTKDGKLDVRADVGVTEAAGAVAGDGIIELPTSPITASLWSVAGSSDGKRIAVTTNADDAGARLVVLEVE